MPHAKVEPGHVGVPGLGVEVAAGLAGAAVSGQHGGDDPVPPAAAGQQPRPEAEGAVRGYTETPAPGKIFSLIIF